MLPRVGLKSAFCDFKAYEGRYRNTRMIIESVRNESFPGFNRILFVRSKILVSCGVCKNEKHKSRPYIRVSSSFTDKFVVLSVPLISFPENWMGFGLPTFHTGYVYFY